MNIGKMMKDLQKMQAKMQEEMETLEIEGSSGGGVVTVRMNGKKELLALKLAPEAITPDDAELLEDLIVAAVNEAGRKVDEEIEQLTQGMAGGMNMLPMMTKTISLEEVPENIVKLRTDRKEAKITYIAE